MLLKKCRIIKIASVVIAVSILLSGCYNGQRLSDLTIIQAIGIDKKDNKTQISLQYLNLDKSTGSTESLSGDITSVAYGTSDSISSAISTASMALSQRVFFGQNKLVILGSEYVQDDLEKGLDYLVRSVDSRPDVLVAISDDKASDVVSCRENDIMLPATKIYELLKLGGETGLGASVTVNNMLNMYSEPTSDIYLPVLTLNNKAVKCKGIAVFSKEKYKKTLSQSQSFGMLFINGNIKNGSLNIKNDALGNVGVEILSSKSKRSAYVSNGQLHFDISIKLRILLNEVEKGTTTSVQQREVKMVESLVNKRVKVMCLSAVKECFSLGSDPFMTGKYLSRDSTYQYNALKDNWREILPYADVNISVHTNLEKVNDNSVRQ